MAVARFLVIPFCDTERANPTTIILSKRHLPKPNHSTLEQGISLTLFVD